MSKLYQIEESNSKWYVSQYDVSRRLTAHAKLDNIRQLMLWIEEQENYDKEAGKIDDISEDDSNEIKWYRYTYTHINK